ncbi:hypothetical protein GEMRC1_010988 [Eukaryota sp. GEM-RC1]
MYSSKVWALFCLNHIKRWLQTNPTCPTCRCSISISDLSVSVALRDAIQLNNFPPCYECRHTSATLYCYDCDVDLCIGCSLLLHKPRTLSRHKLVPIGEKVKGYDRVSALQQVSELKRQVSSLNSTILQQQELINTHKTELQFFRSFGKPNVPTSYSYLPTTLYK